MTEYTRSKYTNQRDESSTLVAKRTRFDPRTDRVSEELVCAVSELTETEPRELPIFSDVIDPDALDGLFRSHSDRASDELVVELEYGGFLARVSSEGHIEFRSP
ncbi:hypothetical protein HUG10_10150 [Halorarum halophilum]|uniref:Halobacterial output domain-containing protein n=1 Tax=Halorarum halophilum TaxID=2743090 RepID=A0A7D5H094_9EURY|nr:HalOD1 output domain-containing protein [Halobaculum halophilum]QLG27893.1 hypothetical protein HUG10_10150 [Halobaculum halophilum]